MGLQTRVWLFTALGPPIPPTSMSRSPSLKPKHPSAASKVNLSYDFNKQRLWASLDGNFWWGGITALNGVRLPDTNQVSSRTGGTVSIPLTKHQSIKAAYSDGTYIRFGGNYQNVSVAWQYSWIGWPKKGSKPEQRKDN